MNKAAPLLFQTPQKKQRWGQLPGCSWILALAEYCEQTKGVKLLVAEDNYQASSLQESLPFFLTTPQELLFFPDWETLAYDQFSPHQDIISQRLYTLGRIKQVSQAIVITSVSTLMHRLCPAPFLSQYTLMLSQGQQLNIANFRNQLTAAGYHCVNKVLEHGEFAVRGSLLDVYPMGSKLPFRIELFDEEIESLRVFDTETQRTIDKISEINLLPAREFPLNEASQTLFRQAFRTHFPGNPSHCPLYEAVSIGQYPAGIEYYLPLFFEQTATLFDYLPEDAKVCLIEDTVTKAEQFWQEVTERYEQKRHDLSRPILPPESCFLTANALLERANTYEQLRISQARSDKKGAYNFPIQPGPALPIDRKSPEPLSALASYCAEADNRYLIVVESAGRREVLLELLKPSQLRPTPVSSWADFLNSALPLAITTGPLAMGCELKEQSLCIITEAQLFGEQSTPQRRRTAKGSGPEPDLVIKDLVELTIGAPVVHLQFGVGRYLGLETISHSNITQEFLKLGYADEDKIYVPVTSLHLISRYTGVDSEQAPLHKLGSDQWQKAKKKAVEKIHDVAIELLDLYAKREAQQGHAHSINAIEYAQFVSGFPFTETEDQLRAIEQIMQDMQSSRPMDRLICGDVGFGKTEVAMRAAFLAVQNGKQVCILVPTTLLADQHFDSFKNRFADFPITIGLLSRFCSTAEANKITASLAAGQLDIVIGTHKLFSKHLVYKQLGLLIIDEEHRFGVKQKEHIKGLRNNIDILSMTATPIPRTLNMALAGIRDISLIATPPAKRLAIKTFWHTRTEAIIKEAILREIMRGGQVFFLHNNVETIGHTCEFLQQLVPEAKVGYAHGQLKERELERIMSDFYHHRFNVLVCSTIIETGIDIPTANTIIIDKAQNFGLAQLHQLRGRVGRSHHQAYAYLLTPDKKSLAADALKRIEALVAAEALGAGFTLASQDLEIRGAGELLGEDQSGNMQAIGFSLFMELLERAVKDLKAGKTPELSAPMHQGPDIELNISAIIPEDYIGDIHSRLIMYKRIANAQSEEQLFSLHGEMIDRFGLLPAAVKHLLSIMALKLKAAPMGIVKISSKGPEGRLEFSPKPNINTEALIKLIQLQASRYKMEGPERLRFTLDEATIEGRLETVSKLLDTLK